jgi:hypothetical protein
MRIMRTNEAVLLCANHNSHEKQLALPQLAMLYVP